MSDWKHPPDEAARLRAWLRVVCTKEGTLVAAARVLGTSQPTLTRVLSQERGFGQKLERALSDYFKRPIEELRSTTPTPEQGRTVRVAIIPEPGAPDIPSADVLGKIMAVQIAICDDLGCDPDVSSSAVGRVLFGGGENLSSEYSIYRAAIRLIAAETGRLTGKP